MKIIVIYGKGNTGKSTAIRRFFDSYVENNSLFSINKHSIETVDIRIQATYRNKVVGIISHGDTMDCVKGGLDFVGQCDVLICACRSKGGAMELIKKASNEIIWLEKETIGVNTGSLDGSIVDWERNEQANQIAARINGILNILL